jgi:hypothetical protein
MVELTGEAGLGSQLSSDLDNEIRSSCGWEYRSVPVFNDPNTGSSLITRAQR